MKDTAEGWNRREFVRAMALVSVAVGIPGCVTARSLPVAELPSEAQIALMREVAQAVIPANETPGAGDAGVGEFVLVALAHGLDGTRDPVSSAAMPWAFPEYRRRDGSLRFVDWLAAALDDAAGGSWLAAAPERRAAVLADLDAAAFAVDAGAHPWRKLKGLILTGYYTSEIGGSQELRYELVPGRFDPKVPMEPGMRAFSSDWTGVEFG